MHVKDRNQYVLMVKNIKNQKGRYVDKIYLKTDSTIRPVIEVVVVGIITHCAHFELMDGHYRNMMNFIQTLTLP
jgi:hypothetical protein